MGGMYACVYLCVCVCILSAFNDLTHRKKWECEGFWCISWVVFIMFAQMDGGCVLAHNDAPWLIFVSTKHMLHAQRWKRTRTEGKWFCWMVKRTYFLKIERKVWVCVCVCARAVGEAICTIKDRIEGVSCFVRRMGERSRGQVYLELNRVTWHVCSRMSDERVQDLWICGTFWRNSGLIDGTWLH